MFCEVHSFITDLLRFFMIYIILFIFLINFDEIKMIDVL